MDILHIESNMTNSFDVSLHPNSVLINASTTLHDIMASLRDTVSTGKRQLEQFVRSAFTIDDNKSFYKPIH